MEILEAILWLLLEVFGDVLFEGLLEFILSAIKEAFGRQNKSPLLAAVGYLLFGAILGGCSVLLFPHHILPSATRRGASLFFSPLGAGLVMESWGQYRRAGGHPTTNLATWHGGGAFAFGMALVRYLSVR